MNKTTKKILTAVISAIVSFIAYYVVLPPINPHSTEFWFFLLMVLLIFGIPLGALNLSDMFEKTQVGAGQHGFMYSFKAVRPKAKKSPVAMVYLAIVGVIIAVLVIGSIISSVVFNSRAYASIIDIEESDFADDMPTTGEVTNIALMDTESARMLGNRKLGALADVISQFVVSNNYTQINYQQAPKKIAPLEYDGFFKWLNNRNSGIPGYIMVDAIENYADYCEVSPKMIYAESAYFSRDLYRAIRFAYPTKIIGNISFEVDEEGNPFYVVSCEKPRVGLFGASDVNEVILFDPVDGSHELLSLDEVPRWVDIVFDGYLACDKYNWHGIYSGGYINSIIGNKGCKQTTDDFGYIMLDDDVWYFTGVTSVTAADASNIGFILSNARTGEYKFYSVIGAEEHSAMIAAQGEVQEKGYVASFPSLVNISGQPTYIMVLKDAGGLVKLYALVNVQQYNMVATGETQEAAIRAYIKTLADYGVDVGTPDDGGADMTEVLIKDIKYLSLSGATVVYVTGEDGRVYKLDFNAANEAIILKSAGDMIYVTAEETDVEGLYTVTAWSSTKE